MSFEVDHEGYVVIVADYDEESGDIGIEDVVDPDTGEIVTDDWFESGRIFDQELKSKIRDESRGSRIDDIF